MKHIPMTAAAFLLFLIARAPARAAEKTFAEDLGAAPVGDVQKTDVLQVPFIYWGGDVATFLANGDLKTKYKDGLTTKPGSTFDKLGLKLQLTKGDDFLAQVKDYLAGKTPFLRGTMSQLGQATEVLDKDPRTQPVVFVQLTWSKGDHIVARPEIKTLNDLKGKKIALQRYGPHVGFLDDELRSVGLKWDDVMVAWTDDVSGEKGPAAAFRKDPSIDACFVITPDMADLTGGLEKIGDGTVNTVKGAHVVDSTTYKNHSIADVYACRKDFFDKNKDLVEKLAAGYLKGCEELVDLKDNHDDAKNRKKDLESRYIDLLATAQDVWGTKDAPLGPDDVHGLITDANFVCLPGNYKFFDIGKDNVIGFQGMKKAAADMAVNVGSAKAHAEMLDAGFRYEDIKSNKDYALQLPLIPQNEPLPAPAVTASDPTSIIYTFTVEFPADGDKVDKIKYEKEFQKAVEEASKYGGAVLDIRGHVDPTSTLLKFVKIGLDKGYLTRAPKPGGGYNYSLNGKPFDLGDTKTVLAEIEQEDKGGEFAGVAAGDNPAVIEQAAKDLSQKRAQNFQAAILEYAGAKKVRLSDTQFKSEGVGIAEPLVAIPRAETDAAKNRRVEFRILKVPAESVQQKDYKAI
jgi:ABC-type nitrate/sulfonate/bicarbonate transport system substrate-binding protein/outer membrane protein OmpA-like peptidoglycan-associated protein